jgi:ABC-type transporter Mla subunit MlaD
LSGREQDFQQLIDTIKSGASDLAAMSQGSKKWLAVHNQMLDDLKASSVERKAVLDNLLKSEK